MRISPILAVGLLAAPAAAQAYYYVDSNTPSSGTCNVIPWGTVNTSTTWRNQRYQVLVPASDLGNDNAPKRICSLAFAPCNTYLHESTTLQITMAQTTATTLSTTFASNLTNRPQIVLKASCHTWPLTGDTWNNVGLQQPYLFIPPLGANLVVEVIVTGNHNTGGSGSMGFHRTSTRQRVFAIGWSGTPPTTGSNPGLAALKMRIGVQQPAIDNYGKGCGSSPGPLGIVGSGTGKVGTGFAMSLTGGPTPAGAGVIMLGLASPLPTPIDLTAAGFTGCKLWCLPTFLFGVAFTGGGNSTRIQLGIPNDGNLACAQLCAQGVARVPAAPGGWTLSGTLRVLIGL